MSEIEKIRTSIAAAQDRLDALTEAAELAIDRGGRAPSPLQITDARRMLAFFQRQLELAGATTGSTVSSSIRSSR